MIISGFDVWKCLFYAYLGIIGYYDMKCEVEGYFFLNFWDASSIFSFQLFVFWELSYSCHWPPSVGNQHFLSWCLKMFSLSLRICAFLTNSLIVNFFLSFFKYCFKSIVILESKDLRHKKNWECFYFLCEYCLPHAFPNLSFWNAF